MLDPFETRLTDMIADALAGVGSVQLVSRPRGDLATVASAPERVTVVTHVLSSESDARFGDDARERRGEPGAFRLQTVLHLSGQAAIDLRIQPGPNGPGVETRRQTLLQVLDRLLAVFHREEVRRGRAFQTDVDLGFELDQFRLDHVERLDDGPNGFAALRVLYEYSGRFWPVEPLAEGDHITALPTRIAILPVQIPGSLRARAGGADLEIPLRLDLRAMAGAPVLLAARLLGASPPGALVGTTTGVPEGWTGFAPNGGGIIPILYRPPADLASPTRVPVSTALAGPSGPITPIADFVIDLSPGP